MAVAYFINIFGGSSAEEEYVDYVSPLPLAWKPECQRELKKT